MTAIGYVFVLLGVLLARQVAAGRVRETPDDLRDLALSVFTGDYQGVKGVITQRGKNTDESSPDGGFFPAVGTTLGLGSTDLIAAMHRLGDGHAYRLGGYGPDVYDCSGLVTTALQSIKWYTGPRFTAWRSSFASVVKQDSHWRNGKPYRVNAAVVGCIVWWPDHHMGVCVGDDRMYSARSSRRTPNIGESTISGDSGYFGQQPEYWVVPGPSSGASRDAV